MNLVSNKIILRFKQGKSILKFLTAGKLSGKNTIVDSDGKTYRRYPLSPWFSWFKSDKWYDDDGKEITEEITLKNGYILKPNGTYSHVTARRAAQQSANKKPAVLAVNKNAPQLVIDNSVKKLGISSGLKSYLEQQGININPETLDPYLLSQLISVLSENPKQQIVVQETPQTNVPIEQERDLNKISDYSKNLVSSTLKSMNTPQLPINGYTKYLIDRFGMKFKKGGSIKKFQNPSSPLFIDWSKLTPAGLELVDRAISQTRAITQPVEERVQKASKRNKNVAAKLLEMWNMGAFKGVIDRKTGKEVTFERAVDGIRGRMTREAEANRDKIWEARRLNFKELNSTAQTSPQYDEMSNPNNIFGTPKNFEFSLDFLEPLKKSIKLPCEAVDRYGRPTGECAAYVNGVLEKNGIRSRGHSYLINSLFKTFINGYDKMEKPVKLNSNTVTDFHKQAADNLLSRLDTLTMNPNHIYTANMYYTKRGVPSSHTEEFFNNAVNEGRNQYATHIGLIYYDADRNQWTVSHNIGHDKKGHLYKEPLYEDLGSKAKYGWGITSIADAGTINPWYSKLIPNWFEKGGSLKKKCKVKKAQLGALIDFIKYPIQHSKSIYGGWFPDKKNYKNTIYINKNLQRLHYYDKNGNLVLNSPVSTGARPGNKEKQGDNKTPEGKFKISYTNTNADKNKFGDTLFYGLSYGSGIGIHGDANNPDGIGRKASHGCIRMPNGLLRCLLSHIGNGVGTQVIIEQHGGIIPGTVMPELMVFGNKGGKKTPYRIEKWGPAIFSFLNRKILRSKDFNDYYVDFNNHKLNLVDINSPNIYNSNTQIVGNFFSESENPNTIGTPNSFYKGLLLGDRQIPIEKFSRFVGFENGKMKVGNREIFGKDTLITPVVNKSMQITGPIDDSYDFGSLKNNFILYLGQGENGRKVLTHDKVKAFNEYGKKYGYPFDVILLDSGRYDSAISNSKNYMSNDYPRKGRIWGITYQ